MEKIVFDTVDSTNAVCRRGVRQGDIQERLIISSTQTEGKGTRDHLWDSEPGGLYCTWYMGPAQDIAQEVWISVFAALGVQDYFAALGIPTSIKWPNDILLDGRKVGGLLAERFVENGLSHLMLGIGINFLQGKDAFVGKEYRATSIAQATGRRLEPLTQAEPLLACISERRMQCEEDKTTVIRSFLEQATIGKEEAESFLRRMYETN